MTDPSDDVLPLDRWSIPVDDPPPVSRPPADRGGTSPPDADTPPPPTAGDDRVPELLRFPVEAEPMPSEGFHPQLLRFGKAG